METYRRKELKMWFEVMKKRYSNSSMETHLEMVERTMFAEDFNYSKKDDIRNVSKKYLQDGFLML